MRLLLTRHGHVDGIKPARFRGRAELELTPTGLAQADAHCPAHRPAVAARRDLHQRAAALHRHRREDRRGERRARRPSWMG